MRGSKEDQDVQVFIDVMEFVGDVFGDEEDGAGFGRVVLIAGREARAAGDDVVNLVFQVGSLQIFPARGEVVEPEAQIGDSEELQIPVVLGGVGGFDIGDGVGDRVNANSPQNIRIKTTPDMTSATPTSRPGVRSWIGTPNQPKRSSKSAVTIWPSTTNENANAAPKRDIKTTLMAT
jgi:hypothetical protein